MFDWRATGISVNGRQSGEFKTVCPQCSAQRKKSHDKCLSVNLTEGLYNCWHCGWTGKAEKLRGYQAVQHWERPQKVYKKPTYKPTGEPQGDKLLQWFASRGIPAEIVSRHKIEASNAWMPQTSKEERVIVFPYFRDGQVVNAKYRTADKLFKMEKDAERCLYGIDDIGDSEDLIIVEGEIDKLAIEVAGMTNCVSVPNGADSDLDCLAADEQRLAHIKRFFLAVDEDEKGQKLQAKLVSRLGRDRCWVVKWPVNCKDADEVLMTHGAERVALAIAEAKPIPIEGAFEIEDLRDEVFSLYDNGVPNGVNPGWNNLNAFYRPVLGQWTAVIAIPGSGKTGWMAALMVNLARLHGWKFCVFPAENLPPAQYAALLAEIYIGMPFNTGPNDRMSRCDLDSALEWLQEHFIILSPNDDELDLDSLLSMAKAYCLRRGINGFVIDPWNELEHRQPNNQTETQYVSHSLIKVRRFAKSHNVHVWIVVHPTKLAKNKDDRYPVPTLYDASGSSHWRNKADFGISIYRHFDEDNLPVEIHVQKVRWKWCGQIGLAHLFFDKVTGRYDELPVNAPRPRSTPDGEDWQSHADQMEMSYR